METALSGPAPERTIPLPCVECGAPLKVPERVTTFSCSWCRAVQVLRLEGGIAFCERVARSRGPAAEPPPSAETDVLAARLAMNRLTAERRSVDAALRNASREFSATFGERLDAAHRQTLVSVMFGCGALLLAIFAFAFGEAMLQAASLAVGTTFGVLLGTAMGSVVVSFRSANALQEELATRLAAVTAAFDAELAELAASFEQAREIAEG